ncbi:MAG: O-antigen ligase family protein [Pseudonocardiaceae bacterium]
MTKGAVSPEVEAPGDGSRDLGRGAHVGRGGLFGRGDLFGQRPWIPVVVFLSTLAVQLALVIIAPPNVGLIILVLAVAAAVVFAGLGSPTFAIALLLTISFFRLALPSDHLPVDPFVLAFIGVIGAAAVAITRRVNRLPRLGALELMMVLYLAWNIGSELAPHSYPAMVPSTGEVLSPWRFILTGAMVPFVLYVVGRFVFDRESAVRWLLWIVMGFFGYSAVVSIAEFAAPGLVWPRFIVTAPDWPGRAVGIFNQPVVNGLLLVIGFVLALFLANQASEPRWRRVIAAAGAVAAIPAIYLTHTRIVWLVFAVVLIAGALWARKFRAGFVITLIGAVVAVAADWSALTSSDRAAGGVASTSEVDDRLNLAATAIAAIKEKPFAGWGISRFIEFNTYQHKQWSPAIDWSRGYGIAAHHTELGITAELGVVGLVLWLAVLVLLVRQMIVAVRALPGDGLCGRGLALAAVLAFACWELTGQTVDLRYFDFLNALVFLLVGIVVGWADRVPRARDVPR